MLTLFMIMLITRFRKWQLRKELKLQAFLMKKGIGFRTRIQKITGSNTFISGYKKIEFEANVRVSGKTVCQKMHTLMGINEALYTGDKVLIRYRPRHATHVIIGNRIS